MPECVPLDQLFLGSVTVGERGQVVIPAHARERCEISPGDKLLAFVHPGDSGVMFLKLDAMATMAEQLQRLMQTASDNSPVEDEEEPPTHG